MKKFLTKVLLVIINILIRLYKKINKQSFNARLWSNSELKKISFLFSGDIVNVSAGNDGDKEHDFYQNYFKNKTSYTITNYKKIHTNNNYKEIILDLENEIPIELQKRFNVVFNHTVLEHIYDTDKAIKNLCDLSEDIIITVVPFLQTYHHEEEFYFDWWRFSPLALINKFKKYNFKTIYINWNKDPIGNIYIFHIATYKPNKWSEIIKLNTKNINQFAPGFQRQKLLSNLNFNSERGIIKSFDNFLQ